MGCSTEETLLCMPSQWKRMLHGPPWSVTKGAAPEAVKAARPVRNGEEEATGRKVLRLVLTQRNQRDYRLCFDPIGAPQSHSHVTFVF